MFDSVLVLEPNEPCLCDTEKKYKKCCRPYLKGMPVPTPEVLVRARWTAYAITHSQFIMTTTHPDSEHYFDNENKWQAYLYRQFLMIQMFEMEIQSAEGNQVVYNTVVQSRLNNSPVVYRQHTATFKKHDGIWKFLSETTENLNEEGEIVSGDDSQE
ncbi:MAG: YchJ family metal-binding protein [Anaerolineae bacterium]